MPLEFWKSFWEIGGVVLLAGTFLFGAGALIVNGKINVKAAKELADFKIKFEGEQQKTAHAQQEASEAKAVAGGFERDIASANKEAAEANERSAALEVEALKLREQLVAQGPREALLRGENRQKLIDALKPFAGQRVDFRNSASVIQVNGKNVMSTPIGDDTRELAVALIGIARDAGWESPSDPLPTSVVSQGIEILVVRDASERTLEAAIALGHALQNVPFGKVHGPVFADSNRIARTGNAPILPDFGKDTIVVEILPHP